VPSDELFGNVFEVIAYDLRRRAEPQNVVADRFDQRCLPAGRAAPESVNAEFSFEQIDDAAVLELSSLNIEQINPYGLRDENLHRGACAARPAPQEGAAWWKLFRQLLLVPVKGYGPRHLNSR
jgi:hypothetical protein